MTEQNDATSSLIAQLKTEHGQIGSIEMEEEGIVLYFRRPKRQEYDAWYELQSDSPVKAGRVLAESCIINGTRADLMAALEKKPAILTCGNGIVDLLTDLAGAARKEQGPKKKIL